MPGVRVTRHKIKTYIFWRAIVIITLWRVMLKKYFFTNVTPYRQRSSLFDFAVKEFSLCKNIFDDEIKF